MKTDMTLFTPRSGGSGGGGGSSIRFEEAAEAPVRDIQNGVGVYYFYSGQDNALYTGIRVPSSYNSGNQISLKFQFYSNDTSGTALLQTIATLIRAGTDVISSTTNQRTSTNAAVTLSAGTQNELQNVTCDLTSTTGQINSVSVSAGDLILVKLKRGSDTATNELSFIEQSCEVTFS